MQEKEYALVQLEKALKGNEMVNEKNRFWIKLLVPIGILLVTTFAVAWGVVGKTVNDHSKTLEKHELKIEKYSESVIKQGKDIEHIKLAVDRIEKKL